MDLLILTTDIGCWMGNILTTDYTDEHGYCVLDIY